MITRIAVVGGGAAGTRLAALAAARGLGVVEDPADADVLVEAVDGLPADRAAALAAHRGADRLLVTTSVTQPVGELAPPDAADRTIALRLGAGAGAELVVPAGVAAWAAEKARRLPAELGLRVVEGVERPVGAELLFGLLNEAVAMHGSGYVDADDLDAAMRLGCGLDRGPLRVLDDLGPATALRALEELHAHTGDPRLRPAGELRRLVATGFHRRPGTHVPEQAAPTGPPVRRVGVVGSGVMANGIAQALVSAGFDVLQVARSTDRVAEALEALDWHLERTRPAEPGGWTGGTDLAALADRDLVVEAVVEDVAVKRDVFAALDRLCRPGAVLATTTSSLSVTACADATSRPSDVVGLHFFNPATTMPLVEVVRAERTGPAALAAARQVCARLGKHVVECGDRPGFVVNALLFPYLDHAVRLVEELPPDRLDAVMRLVHGFPMGPFRLLDLVGADVARRVIDHLGTPTGPAPLLDRAVTAGYLGRKSGRGLRDLIAATTERTNP